MERISPRKFSFAGTFLPSRIVCVLALLFLSYGAVRAEQSAFDHNHRAWDGLVQNHVTISSDGHASHVDYRGLAHAQAELDAYLNSLSEIVPAQYGRFSVDQKLAFLINAYNAFTVSLILEADDEPQSIRDLGSWLRSPWQRRFIPLLGRNYSLDEVEEMLRDQDQFNEPRIHFALNCASIGCPMLRTEAYVGHRIQQQLADQTRIFLTDRNRNRFELEAETLYVSPIFEWYEDDFVNADGIGSLSDYFAKNAELLTDDVLARQRLSIGDVRIRYTDYDWRLNSRAQSAP